MFYLAKKVLNNLSISEINDFFYFTNRNKEIQIFNENLNLKIEVKAKENIRNFF